MGNWPLMAFFFCAGIIVGNLFLPRVTNTNTRIEGVTAFKRAPQSVKQLQNAQSKKSEEAEGEIDYWGDFKDEDVLSFMAKKTLDKAPSNKIELSLAQRVEGFYKNVESIFPSRVSKEESAETLNIAFDNIIDVVSDSEYWKAEKVLSLGGEEHVLSVYVEFYSIKNEGAILDNIDAPSDLYWWFVASVKGISKKYSFSGFGNTEQIKNHQQKLWMTTNLIGDRDLNNLFTFFSFTIPNYKSEADLKFLTPSGEWSTQNGVLWYPASSEEFKEFEKAIIASKS